MRKVIFWIVSIILSALLFFPLMFLWAISLGEVDYHHEWHLWWYDKYLKDL